MMADSNDQLVEEGAMQKMSVAPPDEDTSPQTPAGTADQEAELDEALDQTMDASDPPSQTRPGGGDPLDETQAHPS